MPNYNATTIIAPNRFAIFQYQRFQHYNLPRPNRADPKDSDYPASTHCHTRIQPRAVNRYIFIDGDLGGKHNCFPGQSRIKFDRCAWPCISNCLPQGTKSAIGCVGYRNEGCEILSYLIGLHLIVCSATGNKSNSWLCWSYRARPVLRDSNRITAITASHNCLGTAIKIA